MAETFAGEVRGRVVVFEGSPPPLPEETKVRIERAEDATHFLAPRKRGWPWLAPFDWRARFILRLRLTRVPPGSRAGTCPWQFPAAKLVLPEKEHLSIIKFLTPTITCGPDPCASGPVFLQHPVPPPALDPPVRPHSPRHLRGADPLPRLAPKSGKKRQCSQDTGLSHHAALALCKVLVVWARPWACCSRSRSSASRPSIARCVRTRYTVFCILR